MNTGIFYLYEYENNQRKRNVGFIKVSRRYQTCFLQIHGRGISAGNGASLELYAFYRDGDILAGSSIAALTCFGKNISARLPVSERSFPSGRPLPDIDGFIIKFPGQSAPVFWMASAFFFPVNISMLQSPAPSEETAPDEETPGDMSDTPDRTPEEENMDNESAPEDTGSLSAPENTGNISSPENTEDVPIPEEINGISAPEDITDISAPQNPDGMSETGELNNTSAPEDMNSAPGFEEEAEPDGPQYVYTSPEQEGTEQYQEAKTEDIASPESVTAQDAAKQNAAQQDAAQQDAAQQDAVRQTSQKRARKIQRSDISILPRRFWFLANNSFLLHGYHNYNHLLLAEERGRLWLGVPGIYDPREAKAADLFGFPQFTREYTSVLSLEPEEYNAEADFGYWCRCVGAGKLDRT